MSKEKSKASLYIKPIIILTVAVVSVVLMIVSVNTLSHQVKETDDSGVVDDGGYEGADIGALHVADSRHLIDMIDFGDSGIVFIGRPTCPYCQQFAPMLTRVVKEGGYFVYYYNTDAASQADQESYYTVMMELGIEGVPSLIFLSEGRVMDKLYDTTNEAELRAFLDQYSYNSYY